ncbi:MAG TPA: monofunctional biosynthetic peptidoglycan transglycosylase [Chthoniobacterales bacterium]
MSAKSGSSWKKRLLLGLGIALALILVLPVVHIALTKFWNIPFSPMQAQRWIEAWTGGKSELSQPMRWLALDQIPRPLIHYIWASEDQRFFEHDGFDFGELQKALDEVMAGKKGAGRGASTITMQTARSVYLWQGRSYVRKALEAYYTIWMEQLLSKRRILELYLNHLELGRGVYGVGAGSAVHFGKPPERLTNRQMMALAAVLPNPREWSPARPNAIVQRKIRRIQRLSSNAPFPSDELPDKNE